MYTETLSEMIKESLTEKIVDFEQRFENLSEDRRILGNKCKGYVTRTPDL